MLNTAIVRCLGDLIGIYDRAGVLKWGAAAHTDIELSEVKIVVVDISPLPNILT